MVPFVSEYLKKLTFKHISYVLESQAFPRIEH